MENRLVSDELGNEIDGLRIESEVELEVEVERQFSEFNTRVELERRKEGAGLRMEEDRRRERWEFNGGRDEPNVVVPGHRSPVRFRTSRVFPGVF